MPTRLFIFTSAAPCALVLVAAIADYFAGEIKGVIDLRTLRAKFRPYAEDGAWCAIDEDFRGNRVVTLGIVP